MRYKNDRQDRGPFSIWACLGLVALLVQSASAQAEELTDWLSVAGILAGAGQCQLLTESAGVANVCEGALPFQPELSIHLTESDEVFFKLGFAAGNGLNEESPFALAPWAADLQDDVQNINGRGWDYLFNAWYKHEFAFDGDTILGVTGGIIDATDYLDDNTYANDEYTQFMNEALVNGPNAFLPSYDVGGAIELDIDSWSVRGVVMQVGENEDGNSYTFLGGQAGYTISSSLGEGTYRVLLVGTTDDFLDPTGTSLESRIAGGFSFDQQLGDTFGAWARFLWQSEDAAVNFQALYSGGVNINGKGWGRPDDNIGIGYAYLNGGNLDITGTHVAEAYYRLVAWENFGFTFDAQYMRDNLVGGGGPDGFVLGLRVTAELH